jgi:GNAT superfamily N-acetyltransferase
MYTPTVSALSRSNFLPLTTFITPIFQWPADTHNFGAIGFIYLYPTVSSNIGPQGIVGELNVGIILKKEFRGDGYAKQALTTVLDYAFKTLSCHRVQALIVDNYTKQHALTLFTQLYALLNHGLLDYVLTFMQKIYS